MINSTRLNTANQIMHLLFPSPTQMQLTIRKGRVCLQWTDHRGKTTEKKWECRNGSDYPTIAHQIPTGGTHIRAIGQLVNWVKDRPVRPIQTWQYWCSDTIGMKPKDEILSILEDSDYPKKYECQWCGNKNNLDWYSFGKHSGLGCMHSNRCEPLHKLLLQWQRRAA